MGLGEALIAVPVIILIVYVGWVYVGWVILQALAASAPGFLGYAILLMAALVLGGIGGILKTLT